MYKLSFYAPQSTWSLRVWLLLKELNIPFKEQNLPVPTNPTEKAELLEQVSPTGKVPVLHHNDFSIWDSLAIMEYLAEDHPQVWAKDKMARAWSRCVCAEMHSGFEQLRSICHYDEPLKQITLDEIPASLALELKRIDQIWSEGLEYFGGPFLAGEKFTAVDAFFAPVVGRIQTYGLHEYLSLTSFDYQQRIQNLTSLREWLKK